MLSDPALPSQGSTPLLDALCKAAQMAGAPFYAPGHKHGRGAPIALTHLLGAQVFQADLPELPELDNLFAPEGAIYQAQVLAAEVFGADRTWFLANGSTSGVMAAILATCQPGDKILLPRNIHQSAISGLILSGAIPVFLNPEYDSEWNIAYNPTPASVVTALAQHPEAKAVMLVCPTYHGVCGNVAAIAEITHQHNIPLLVDEAHGPHFAFHPDLPTPALAAGADLSVQSTHKVLSAMTQAAMLHVQGNRVDGDRLHKALSLVQSTSPSYLLLASLDAARHQMATQGQELMEQTLQRADQARSQISQILGCATFDPDRATSPGFFALDRTRLTVRVSDLGISGFTADEILHQQYGVTAELPSLNHLTFIVSLGNTDQDIERLIRALRQVAKMGINKKLGTGEQGVGGLQPLPTTDLSPLTPRDAFFAPTEQLPIAQAIDRISAELICPYPPGIPVLMPGERITPAAVAYLQTILAIGGVISGCADPSLKTLKVVRN